MSLAFKPKAYLVFHYQPCFLIRYRFKALKIVLSLPRYALKTMQILPKTMTQTHTIHVYRSTDKEIYT